MSTLTTPHGDEKRTHRYTSVATELAQELNRRFKKHHDRNRMPEALIAAAMTLVAKLKEMPGIEFLDGSV